MFPNHPNHAFPPHMQSVLEGMDPSVLQQLGHATPVELNGVNGIDAQSPGRHPYDPTQHVSAPPPQRPQAQPPRQQPPLPPRDARYEQYLAAQQAALNAQRQAHAVQVAIRVLEITSTEDQESVELRRAASRVLHTYLQGG